jgi:peptidylamidoglycolate lyase
MRKEQRPASAIVDRRTFCSVVGTAALAALAIPRAGAAAAMDDSGRAQPEVITGNGEWTYKVSAGWGRLPAGTVFGGTHGGIATDKAGHVYVSTQSATGILVYSPEGLLLRTIAN